MDNILEIKSLCKNYNGFHLQNIDLALPKGSIMGFVGENGAGKSTTIKLILNLIKADNGTITIFGKDHRNLTQELKEQIGVVFDENNFPEYMTPKDVSLVMKNIYKGWDSALFNKYIKVLDLPKDKPLKEYSRGMKMKLSIAVALSHHAQLLLLDEPTSGLDPIVRDEILDIFLDFIQNEEHSIFISSHIITDLEKIADFITFIHQGEIIFSETKDELLCEYGLLKCSHTDLDRIDKKNIYGLRKSQFNVEALVKKKEINGRFLVEKASLEDIMLFMTRGETDK